MDSDWCQVEPYGVRAKASEEEIYLGDLFVTGSFQKGSRQTDIKVLVQCVAASGLPSADLIKIDTEGCEVEILQNIDLSKAKAVILEHHCLSDALIIKKILMENFDLIHDQSDRDVGTEIFLRKLLS